MFQLRHGDFYITPADMAKDLFAAELAQKAVEVPRADNGDIIFGYGETTGHMHVIADAERLITAERHGDIVTLHVEHPTLVQHTGYDGPRDHNDLQLPPGDWVIIPQREYDPVLDNQSRPVFD